MYLLASQCLNHYTTRPQCSIQLIKIQSVINNHTVLATYGYHFTLTQHAGQEPLNIN